MNMDLEHYKRNAAPGYRFLPKDGDMLQYLHRKEQGDRHPHANLFKDVPLYDFYPDELQRKFGREEEDEWYVFFTASKPFKGSRMPRKAGINGRWKVTIGDRKITDYETKLMGFKKTLRFSFMRDGKEEKTGWNMLEYRLAHANGKQKMMGTLFLCKIYKRRSSRNPSEALEDDMRITSSDSVQCSTNVTNGREQDHSFDVTSKECVQNEFQLPEQLLSMGADPNNIQWILNFLMDDQFD